MCIIVMIRQICQLQSSYSVFAPVGECVQLHTIFTISEVAEEINGNSNHNPLRFHESYPDLIDLIGKI